MQTADDIAQLVGYLISAAAEQVTGQVLAVDGGLGGQGFAERIGRAYCDYQKLASKVVGSA